MESGRYKHAARLFDEAMELPPAERLQYVRQEASGDEDLAARVLRMIGYSDRPIATKQLFAVDPAGRCAEQPDPQLIGVVVGHYRIASLIGEGGFGAVYQAEQERPVRRSVAMKILKSGMDSQQVIARFQAERQALAMMEHPGIARVIDAGQTEPINGSRPYFVMELVVGEPITAYCDRKTLGLRSRLELFMTVCQAVQHAHQRGIIHRDLKPSNILVSDVDGVAMPKVIDFGIAKAMHQPLTDGMLVTNRMELLGTPQYMSPEQADADERAIDTRTDVYSLGAVLYELLAGTTPLDGNLLRSAGYSRMLQMIQEQKIERPSTRVMTMGDAAAETARCQQTDVKSLSRRLLGELDWIVLKALDFDRDRRYDSAAALAQDLRRYMNHEPVEAGPPGVSYRMRKFVRRHRIGVAATTLVLLAVIGGAIGTSIGMVRARDSAEQARDAADEAQKINQFMAEVLTSVDPDRGKGADVRLVEVLATASATSSQRFEGHPELEAQVRGLLGAVYAKLSLYPQALRELAQTVVLSETVYGRDDQRSLEARLTHLQALASAGRSREVAEQVDGLASDVERVVGRNHDLWFSVRQVQGQELSRQRKWVEAATFLEQLWGQSQSAVASEEVQISIMRGLRQVYWRQLERSRGPERRQIQAKLETLARETVERSVRTQGPSALLVLDDQVYLAQSLNEMGHYDEVCNTCLAVLAASEERLGNCHAIRANAIGIMSLALYRLGRFHEAADFQLRELECRRQVEPILLVSTLTEAIPVLDRAGRWADGERCARELAQKLGELGGGHGPMVLDAELAAAHFVSRQGRKDEADQLFAQLLTREVEASENSGVLARMHMFYGAHLVSLGEYGEAERRLQQAAATVNDIRNGTWNWTPDDLIVEFIALYQAWGKPERIPEYERLQYEALHPLEWTDPTE